MQAFQDENQLLRSQKVLSGRRDSPERSGGQREEESAHPEGVLQWQKWCTSVEKGVPQWQKVYLSGRKGVLQWKKFGLKYIAF